jgi:hypothetical protein
LFGVGLFLVWMLLLTAGLWRGSLPDDVRSAGAATTSDATVTGEERS